MANPSTGRIPQKAPQDPVQANMAASRNILLYGVERMQQIYSTGTNPANQTVINIAPQAVGLVRGFLVKVEGVISNTDVGSSGVALARTPLGASNLLRNIQFNDTNNQNRHQTQGWHLSLINSARQPMVFGGAYAPNVPMGYGNNWDVQTAPSTVAASANANVQYYYYVPISYGRTDLRGAMWAGVVNAVANLQLEINPTPVVASGDSTLAAYSGNTGGWLGNVTITVWQDYIDQVPLDSNNQPILPQLDLQMLYQLQNTALTGLVTSQDFGVPFANFRNFLSTVIGYDNGGTLANNNINYFAMQTANSSNIWKYGPEEASLFARATFMADPPLGFYYFDNRAKPVSTQQFGNTQITVNPQGAVNSGAVLLVGYEYFAQASQVVFAGSLPSGG